MRLMLFCTSCRLRFLMLWPLIDATPACWRSPIRRGRWQTLFDEVNSIFPSCQLVMHTFSAGRLMVRKRNSSGEPWLITTFPSSADA